MIRPYMFETIVIQKLLPHHLPDPHDFPVSHGLQDIHAIGVSGQVDLCGL